MSRTHTDRGEGLLNGAVNMAADGELPHRLRHEHGADDQAVIIDIEDTLGLERLDSQSKSELRSASGSDG